MPRAPATPHPPADAELSASFPALAHLLGPARFADLCAAARSLAAARETAPGAQIHGLLVRRAARADDRIPSRLAADIAALEWSLHEVAARTAPRDGDNRVSSGDLAALPDWRAASLQPARAFNLIEVAFRLETWVRRVRSGRRVPRLPLRGEQHILVYAPPFAGTDGAPVWWSALTPGLGRLLARLARGMPIGAALDGAVASGALPDDAAARAHLDAWLHEGLFARVLPPGE